MNLVSKALIGLGLLLILVGMVWAGLSQLGGRQIPLGRLPGDIAIERENFKFYFPLASSILVSVVISALLYLLRKLWP